MFAAVQMGRGYHGRIVVKHILFGYDKQYNRVERFTNRGEVLYRITQTYSSIVSPARNELGSMINTATVAFNDKQNRQAAIVLNVTLTHFVVDAQHLLIFPPTR